MTLEGFRRENVRTTDKNARGSRTIDDRAKGRDTKSTGSPGRKHSGPEKPIFPRISDHRNAFMNNNDEVNQRGVSRKKASVCRPCPKAIGAEHKDATAMRITT